MKIFSQAPTNIAVIKYWGKNPKFEDYHIPTKSSLSFSVLDFYTKTYLDFKPGNGTIFLELNNKKINPNSEEFLYIKNFFEKLSTLIKEIKNYDYSIKTENNFPTAAGFASSASGVAALAVAIAKVFELSEPKIFEKYFNSEQKISSIARIGSGSAARSVPSAGGCVLWSKPKQDLTTQDLNKIFFCSDAKTLFPPNHWEDLRIFYIQLEKKEKKIKSRSGMKQSVSSCPIYSNWVDYEENILLPSIIKAIEKKDFENFAKSTIKASNGLHAIMYYTFPRIRYLTDKSEQIIELVLDINSKSTKLAYSFDAGPNPVLFTLKDYQEEILDALSSVVNKKDIFITKPGAGAFAKVI